MIILELTKEEARMMRDVTDNIGGDPNTSRRRYADQVCRKLKKLGFDYSGNSDMHGSISFIRQPITREFVTDTIDALRNIHNKLGISPAGGLENLITRIMRSKGVIIIPFDVGEYYKDGQWDWYLLTEDLTALTEAE